MHWLSDCDHLLNTHHCRTCNALSLTLAVSRPRGQWLEWGWCLKACPPKHISWLRGSTRYSPWPAPVPLPYHCSPLHCQVPGLPIRWQLPHLSIFYWEISITQDHHTLQEDLRQLVAWVDTWGMQQMLHPQSSILFFLLLSDEQYHPITGNLQCLPGDLDLWRSQMESTQHWHQRKEQHPQLHLPKPMLMLTGLPKHCLPGTHLTPSGV